MVRSFSNGGPGAEPIVRHLDHDCNNKLLPHLAPLHRQIVRFARTVRKTQVAHSSGSAQAAKGIGYNSAGTKSPAGVTAEAAA